MHLPAFCRRRRLCLLYAVLPPGTVRAAPAPAVPVELSAEAIELIGREAEQTRQLAEARRRLAAARQGLPRARSPEAVARLQQAIQELEPRIQVMEARLRLRLPPRQVRQLPVAALKAYVARVRRRIEWHGDQHVPQENGQALYGSTDIAFTLRADGTLAHLQVQRAVPRALGLQTALLVQGLAPFEPFPRAVAAQVERISFVRSFRFEPGEPRGEPRYRLRSRPPPRAAGGGGA
jgi:outer membrane biosynthesis protein TonB